MPLVTVIIPTYNRSHYVTEAIDSVLAQTFTDYEIIVIDDGSTDNTKEVLRPYLSKIRYIYQDNKGVSAARNTGLEAAQGEWIAFLDSDDIWDPKKLEIQFDDIHLHDSIDLHICNGEYLEEDSRINIFDLRRLSPDDWSEKIVTTPFSHILQFKYHNLQLVLIRKNPTRFNEQMQYSEDLLYLGLIALNTQKWFLRSDPLVQIIRRVESSNISLTQRCKDNFCFRMNSDNTVADKLESYIHENNQPRKHLTALSVFRSNNYFTYAIRSQNHTESRKYLMKGLTVRPTVKNFIKYFVYLIRSYCFQLLAENDRQSRTN